ncbi:MAG: hypothetical protein AB2L18_05775 [Anaerolineaceae bacterium]
MPHRVDRAEAGRQASVSGFANEHIVVGILMQKYSNVSLVDLPLSSYDIVLVRKKNGLDDFIRIQVKTATTTVSFIGGSRGGVDRNFDRNTNISKEYKQSTETSDVICGIHKNEDNSYDLYFIPTILIEQLTQKSISINRIHALKNFEFLENCKDFEWVSSKARQIGLIT